jgi:hypothetical protein
MKEENLKTPVKNTKSAKKKKKTLKYGGLLNIS